MSHEGSFDELEAIYRVAPVGLGALDAELRWLRVNDRLAAMVGAPADALVGRPVREALPALAGAIEPVVARLLATGRPCRDVELAGPAAGARPAWLTHWHPLRDAQQRVVGVGLVAEDVAALRAVESTARLGEARMRALVTATTYVTYRMNADWSRMLELDGVGLLAEMDSPGESWLAARVHPADRKRVLVAIADAIRNRRTLEIEHRVQRRDGTTGWALSRAVPLFDERGEILEWCGAASDVTARREAQEGMDALAARLARQIRLFEGVASTTPDFIYVFDREGRFLYANRRLLEVWGRRLEDVIGRTCLELGYEPWHHEMHMREIAQVIDTRRPIKGEVPFRAPLTGIYGVYEYIFSPVLGPDGEVEVVAGTTRDVTERKQVEDALRESDRAKDDFLAMLAHELRNPLAPLTNAHRLIERAHGLDGLGREALAIAQRQTRQMQRLVDDLLEMSRLSRGLIELRPERVDAATVVRHAVESVEPECGARGHRLTVRVPDAPIALRADPVRLVQVLENLLHNACKYTPDGGALRVEVERVAGGVEFRVIDDGIGIEPEQLSRLFVLFHQLDRSLDRAQGGLGIGLALVRRLVELHGGSVSARSDGLGRGSTFVVRLPLDDDA